MKIIYLDQFIVSDLADSANQEWKEVRQLLEELANSGEICCPLSIEHYLESSSRRDEEALSNDTLLNTLSRGKCFYLEFHITTFLINAFLKDKPFTLDMFVDEAVKNIFEERVEIEKFRTANEKYRDIIMDKQSFANEIRTITREKRIKLPLKSPMFQVTKRLPSVSFVERLEESIREGKFEIRGEQTPHGEIPNWIDIILEYLLRHFKITPPELVKLHKEVKENGFDNIPTLDIISSLRAYQTIFHKKVTANDEIDNLRIACGLPISNVLFTDKKRKFEILDIGLDSKYQCKVLSGSENDIIELNRYLKEIKTVGNI